MNTANLRERIKQAEKRFDELTVQIQELDTERTKLQGEWRVLKELAEAETDPANKITALAAKEDN